MLYFTQNITETVTTAKGKRTTLSAPDRFEAALDTDIPNVLHMKAILSEHVNFLNAFINKSVKAA